jgi:hypothetical protein
MLTKTKIALAAALVFGSASVALATAGENAQGGFDTLGSNGQSVESPRSVGNGGNAYGYVDRTTPAHHASQHRSIER